MPPLLSEHVEIKHYCELTAHRILQWTINSNNDMVQESVMHFGRKQFVFSSLVQRVVNFIFEALPFECRNHATIAYILNSEDVFIALMHKYSTHYPKINKNEELSAYRERLFNFFLEKIGAFFVEMFIHPVDKKQTSVDVSGERFFFNSKILQEYVNTLAAEQNVSGNNHSFVMRKTKEDKKDIEKSLTLRWHELHKKVIEQVLDYSIRIAAGNERTYKGHRIRFPSFMLDSTKSASQKYIAAKGLLEKLDHIADRQSFQYSSELKKIFAHKKDTLTELFNEIENLEKDFLAFRSGVFKL